MPLHIRNAPTRLMKELNYGKGYKYAHNEADGIADMDCLPPSLAGKRYLPANRTRIRGGDSETHRRVEERA